MPRALVASQEWGSRRARSGLLALALGALLLALALPVSAQATSAKGYGELARFGEAEGTTVTAGKLQPEGTHLIGVEASTNDVYVLDEPEESEESLSGEEVKHFYRVQKFSPTGSLLASATFQAQFASESVGFEFELGEELEKSIEGIVIDPKLERIYMLTVAERKVEPDIGTLVASELYAFSTAPNKKDELQPVKSLGGKKGLFASKTTMEAQSTKKGQALLEPAGITVDSATGEVLVLAHEDTRGTATDEIANAGDHFVLQAVTSEGALSTRYVDTNNVLKPVKANVLIARPDSPVLDGPEGSEHVVVNLQGSLVQIPASLSSATEPTFMYTEKEPPGVFPVEVGVSSLQGGGLSVSPEGVLFGAAHIEDEEEGADEIEPGVVLRSGSNGAEIGWTGGQEEEVSSECVLEPGDEGEESYAVAAAGKEGKVFVLSPGYFALAQEGAESRAIVELGPGGTGCPQPSTEGLFAEVAGHEVEEEEAIPVNTPVTFSSELIQTDSLASTWSFGDGAEETISVDQYEYPESKPHSYSSPGEYAVSATIKSDDLAAPDQVIFNGSSFTTPTFTVSGHVLISGAPAVHTEAAGAIMKTAATLHAMVNPNSVNVTECRFEYGTSLPSGKFQACGSLPGEGKSAVPVSALLTGLEADTTYSYRIVAKNAEGESVGQEVLFTTLPEAPKVTTGEATEVTQTRAVLSASVDPNGGAVESCTFEYGTSTSYGHSAPCLSTPGAGKSAVPVSAHVSGLLPHTTYVFRIVATNAGGTGEGEPSLSFETLAPAAPTVTSEPATPVGDRTATLNGHVNANGSEVQECRFEYGTSLPSGKFQECEPLLGKESVPVSVTAKLNTLEPITKYHFRLIARNEVGVAVEGAELSFTTEVAPPTVTTEPAASVGQTSATLNGQVDPNGTEVKECQFEYGITLPSQQFLACESAPGSGRSAVTVAARLGGLTPGTRYSFRIIASNEEKGAAEGATLSFGTEAAPPATAGNSGGGSSNQKPLVFAGNPVTAVPDALLASTSLSVSAKGTVTVKVSCPAAESSCAGTITLRTLTAMVASAKKKKPAILTLASGAFNVAGGHVQSLTLHLSSVARALLSRSHTLRARATLAAHDPAGHTHTGTATVTLRLAKPKHKH